MGKKHKCPEFENHERWLVSYADMVTLLFAVFVVLYAIQMAGKKSQQAQVSGSMQESFNTPLEDIPVDRSIGPGEHGYGIFEHMKGTTTRPPIIQRYPGQTAQIKIIDGEMNRVQKELEERLYGSKKFREKTKAGQERIVSVERTTKGFKLQLTARHFFESGSVKVQRAARKELDAVVDIVKDLGRPVTIMGHTDSTPAGGKYTNWEISALRATNVVKYMVRKHNFPSTKLSVAGYADLRPIAHNGTSTGRAMNRRIEVHIDYVDEMVPQ